MGKHKSKRIWHTGKPKKKPDYNPETVTEEFLEEVVNAYERLDEHGKHLSLQVIAERLDCGLNPMKVRKLLITAGEVRGEQVYKKVGCNLTQDIVTCVDADNSVKSEQAIQMPLITVQQICDKHISVMAAV